MSVARPLLEYVSDIKTKKSLSETYLALKRLVSHHKRYYALIVLTLVLCIIRSYLFTLEPLFTSYIIDEVIIGGRYDLLQQYLAVILLSGLGVGVSVLLISYVHGTLSQNILRDIRSEYYKSLSAKSFGFYDSVTVGDLVSRATMDLQAVDGFLRIWLSTIFNAFFSIVAIFSVIYSTSPSMTLVSMATMPLIFYFNTRLFVETMPLFRKMQLILGRLSSYIQQDIVGMKTVRILGLEEDIVQGFKEVEQVFVNTAIAAGRIQSIYMPLSSTLLTLGIALVYVYAGYSISAGYLGLTIGSIILFARYMIRLTFPLRDLSMMLGVWINASAGLERVFEIIDMPRIIEDSPGALDIIMRQGKVEFDGVTFGYEKDRPVLNGVSFQVNPGERIAILGATGSGKSTLMFLLPRFYDPDSGSIRIDGTDIRRFKLASLRKQIGVVLQDVFLFSGTIRDNIAFGNPNASPEQIVQVAKTARIHDFIQSLPEGYDTKIGERGVTLSGGERQRLTIARALLTNPRILIMDDSLSFVDSKTEQEIQIAIEEAMRTRTAFIIAQRLSTVKNADKILVLDEGKVLEFGPHDELIARRGAYRRIYESQFIAKRLEANREGENLS